MVGNVPVGSQHPVARQTMTTTDTRDVEATVAQVRCRMRPHSLAAACGSAFYHSACNPTFPLFRIHEPDSPDFLHR